MPDDKFIFDDAEFTTQKERRVQRDPCVGCSISGKGIAACVQVQAAAGRDCTAERIIFVKLRG